jgi:hypothetical protein
VIELSPTPGRLMVGGIYYQKACKMRGLSLSGLRPGVAALTSGGVVLVQDPLDAFAPSMPRSAARHLTVDCGCPLDQTGPLLSHLAADGAKPTERETPDIRRRSPIRTIGQAIILRNLVLHWPMSVGGTSWCFQPCER